MSLKRTHDGQMADRKDKKEQSGGPGEAGAAPESPFVPMFRNFRADLDEHTDRRERIVKASRDVTAASKKMYVCTQSILINWRFIG